MKKTGVLKVAVSPALDRTHLVLHPNDGFDLGLMRVVYPVRLCRPPSLEEFLRGQDGDASDLEIHLRNECPHETLLLGLALHRALGSPATAVVLLDGERLFLHSR